MVAFRMKYITIALAGISAVSLLGFVGLGQVPFVGKWLAALGVFGVLGAALAANAWLPSGHILPFGKLKNIAGILGVLLILGSLGYVSSDMFSVSGAASADASGEELNCGDVTSVTEYVRVKDAGASTLTYLTPTVYFQPEDGTHALDKYASGLSSGTYNSTTLLPCKKYNAYGVTSAGAISASSKESFTTGKVGGYHDLTAYDMSYASIRVKDVAADEYENLFVDNTATGTNTTTYSDLNTTLIFEDTAATDISVGADGKLEEKILIKSAATNQYFCAPGNKMWITVDEGTDGEWKEPSISFDGLRLTNQKSAMHTDDLTGSIVQAADWAFPVDKAVDDVEHVVDFVMQADSGQNPDTTNDDVTVSFLCEGNFVSSDVANTIKTGVYTDAATQLLVSSDAGYVPQIVFQIQ